MGIYYDFPFAWWIIVAIVFGLYFFLLFIRKGYKKPKELKAQSAAAIIFLGISIGIEYIAISSGLWTYFPGNWPIILWVVYLGSGLFAYQMGKFIEDKLKEK